jgi:hypothetical protein
MGGHDPALSTAANYRTFAGEARGRSPAYEALGAVYRSDLPTGLPALAARAPDVPLRAFRDSTFVLARDGRTPLALADGHGAWLRWLPDGGLRRV